MRLLCKYQVHVLLSTGSSLACSLQIEDTLAGFEYNFESYKPPSDIGWHLLFHDSLLPLEAGVKRRQAFGRHQFLGSKTVIISRIPIEGVGNRDRVLARVILEVHAWLKWAMAI